ncbi:MAG: NADH-quinone oxidoreductase subunit H, partial [Nocardioidaceae bacterium]
GWRAPWPISLWSGANTGWWPLLWFFGKIAVFVFVFIWLRGTLPRMRYDQFMKFGWKRLIPISLLWIMAVATIRAISLNGGIDRGYLLAGIGVVAVLFLVMFFIGGDEEQVAAAEAGPAPAEEQPFDAFAGGYPVPPLPGQTSTPATVPSGAATVTAEEQE